MSDSNTNFNLVGNYAKVSLIILIMLMLCIGWWVNHTIQKEVIDNTAINASLYAQSIIAPELQGLSNRTHLSDEEIAHLEQLLSDTPLGQKIRSLKIWTLDGQLLYHPQAEMIGRQFEPTESLLLASKGQIAAEFDEVAAGPRGLERDGHVHRLVVENFGFPVGDGPFDHGGAIRRPRLACAALIGNVDLKGVRRLHRHEQ